MNSRSPTETDPPPLRERLRQATAAAILAAAEEVFAEQGVHTARMNDIAHRAGVAVGTLYNHFEDKDALLAGLLVERKRQVLELVDRVVDGPAPDFRTRLRNLLATFFGYYQQHRAFYRIYAQGELQACGPHAPLKDKLAPEMARQIHARMEKLVKRGVREKALRASGTALYPALLMGTLRAMWMHDLLSEEQQAIDVDEVVRFFLDGASASPREGK